MNEQRWFRGWATAGVLLLTMGQAPRAWGWSKSFDGDRAPNAGQRVAALPGGDVVAYASTGRRYYPGGYDSLEKLVRFSGASGTELWRSDLLGESAGALLVAPGWELYSATWHGAVSRLRETDGTRLWIGSVAGTCSGYNTFTWDGGLAAHESGDVIAGATGCAGTSNVAKFTVGRLNRTDGAVVWRTQVESTLPHDQQPSGISRAVAADAAGDVVAVGEVYFTGPPAGGQFLVVKFDGESGEELWRQALTSPSAGATAVAIDGQNNVIVAGTVSGVLTVCKFSPDDGAPVWNQFPIGAEPAGCRQRFFANDPNRVFAPGEVLQVAVDDSNNVIVGARQGNVCPGSSSVLLLKFGAFDGNPVWSGLHPGHAGCPSFASQLTNPQSGTRMAVGAGGDVAVIGAGADNNSSWVTKVDGATGVELWSKPFPELGRLQDVALDGTGNVLVTGTDDSRYLCTSADVLVAKLRGSDGAIAPACGNGVEDVDEECDDGNTTDNDGCSRDCTVEHGCCGDGVKQWNEECDDSNLTAGDGCSSSCLSETTCGDGQRSVGEKCDDGNAVAGDGCAANCTIEGGDQLLRNLAPVVYMDHDEHNFPMDPGFYVGQCAALSWWHGGESCHSRPLVPRGRIRSSRLGQRHLYRHKPNVPFSCRHLREQYFATGSVRPKDDGPLGQGFFLDSHAPCDQGSPGLNAPALYDRIGNYLVYWFFYAYNDAPSCIVDFNHEGDWENITIQLDEADQPLKVVFFAHGEETERCWEDVSVQGTHPLVFGGKGSHASYPAPGFHDVPVDGSPCSDQAFPDARWDTGQDLRPVRGEPWWGFGGAWGEVGELGHSTGPKGPGPGKTGLPGASTLACPG
jgi:cysteine-rich repeat protein